MLLTGSPVGSVSPDRRDRRHVGSRAVSPQLVSADVTEAFARDGVVLVRGAFDPAEVEVAEPVVPGGLGGLVPAVAQWPSAAGSTSSTSTPPASLGWMKLTRLPAVPRFGW